MRTTALAAAAVVAAASFLQPGGGAAATAASTQRPAVHLPWREAGLSERQAAAHLLNRFAYGPRPGQVDAVVAMGLDRWFEQQLAGNLPDPEVARHLRDLPALQLTSAEILAKYPPPALVLAEARRAGVVPAKSDLADFADDKKDLRAKVMEWGRGRGYRPQRELLGQLMAQKLYRAVESENQLAEVMTDFWFNHFNVSMTDNKTRPYLLSYERDAIRPHALGRVRDLLEATAKHPAMLLYLDNAQSTAPAGTPTTMAGAMERLPRRGGFGGGAAGFGRRRAFGPDAGTDRTMARQRQEEEAAAGQGQGRPKRPQGLNENYARELMELHTLGVDGGYTQQDVIEVARAFTGWTLVPPQRREEVERRLERARRVGGMGFVVDGDFLFRADAHDAGAKTILGQPFPAGRGLEDGEQVLDLLAAHRATARHIATQLAARFVSDQPPASLVDRLSAVYLESGGDTRRLVAAIAGSPEFWSRAAVGAKIKSPFELAASALRATGSRLDDPRATLQWIARIGEPLYAYQAPTGYPDRGEAWVNTGSLLNRMNFGLQLAAGRVPGVDLDLPALAGGREPESREEALRAYSALLLPGRDLESTIKLLRPLVSDPELAQKVDAAAPPEPDGKAKAGTAMEDEAAALLDDEPAGRPAKGARLGGRRNGLGGRMEKRTERHPPTPLEQVAGVVLGSPEFQRR
jgi:uncharacterized protein (DUF1800 family)